MADGNSDIVLEFGMDYSENYHSIVSEIENLANELDQKFGNIKIGFDAASLNTMKAQIAEIQGSLELASKTLNLDSLSSAATSMLSLSNGIRQFTSSASGMTSDLGATVSSVAREFEEVSRQAASAESSVGRLASDLKGTNTNLVTSALKQLNGLSDSGVKQITEQLRQMSGELTEVQARWVSAGEGADKAAVVVAKVKTETGDTIQQTIHWSEAEEVVAQTVTQVGLRFDDAANRAGELKVQTDALSAAMTKARSALTSVEGSATSEREIQDAQELRTQYEALQQKVTEFNNARNVDNGVRAELEAEISEFASYAQSISTASEKAAQFKIQMESLSSLRTSVSKSVSTVSTLAGTEEELARVKELQTAYQQWAVAIETVRKDGTLDSSRQAELEAEGKQIQSLTTEILQLIVQEKQMASTSQEVSGAANAVSQASESESTEIEKLANHLAELNAQLASAWEELQRMQQSGNVSGYSQMGGEELYDSLVGGIDTGASNAEWDAQIDKIDQLRQEIAQCEAEMQRLSQVSTETAESAGQVGTTMEQSANNATESVSRLGAQLQAAKTYLNELKGQGLGLGDADYDKAYQDVERLNAQIKQYEATLREAAGIEASSTQQTKEASVAEKQYASLLSKAQGTLNSYSKAKRSMNSESRDAYDRIQQETKSLIELWNSYTRGETSLDKMQAELSKFKTSLEQSRTVIEQNGDATKSFADRVANLASKFTAWLSVSRVIMQVYRALKNMVSVSIELDDAMAQLQIVTKATTSELESFLESATTMAQELGQSITDVLGAIETFARLGYNFEESSSLAEYATILANVANTDVDTATTGLTSILKGYDLAASDAEHIADVLITVGQEYAISAEELMEAFERGGAALSATGATIEQSAALFAATNAALQDASTTGVMWKTVSARIRGARTELEEMGEDAEDCADGISKYRNEVLQLTGVDIMINDNTYKDIYDIFVELAEVWDTLSDTAQSRVSEILGGTRQLSGISSTISNISDAMGAYESAMDSAGAATEANDIYMQTVTAHMNQFKVAFQELGSDLFNSDMLRSFVDMGTGLISTLDNIIDKFGALNTVVALVAGGLSFKNVGVFSVMKTDLEGLTNQVGLFGKSLHDISADFNIRYNNGQGILGSIFGTGFTDTDTKAINDLADQIEHGAKSAEVFNEAMAGTTSSAQKAAKACGNDADALRALTTTTQTATVATVALRAAQVALNMVLAFAISAAISAIVTGIKNMIHALDNAKEALADAESEFESATSDLEDLQEQLEEINQQQLNLVSNDELDKLEEVSKELEYQITLAKELARINAGETLESAEDLYNQTVKSQYASTAERILTWLFNWPGWNQYGYDQVDVLPIVELYSAMGAYQDAQEGYIKARNDFEDFVSEHNVAYEDLSEDEQETYDSYKSDVEAYEAEMTAAADRAAEMADIVNSTKEAYEEASAYTVLTEEQTEQLEEMTNAMSTYGEVFSKTNDEVYEAAVKSSAIYDAMKESLSNEFKIYPEDILKDLINEWIASLSDEQQELVYSIVVNTDIDTSGWDFSDWQNIFAEELKASFAPSVGADLFNDWIDSLTHEQQSILYNIAVTPEIDTSAWETSDWQDALESYFNVSDLLDDDFQDVIDTYTSDMNELDEALEKIRNGEFEDSDFVSLVGDFAVLADGSEDLEGAIVALQDSMDADMIAAFEAQFGNMEGATEGDIAALTYLENAVLSARETFEETELSFDVDLDEETAGIQNLTTALEESASASGLSADSVQNLKDRYQELADFDAASLFDNTSNGIKLNTSEMKKLEKEYQNTVNDKFKRKLESLTDQYNDAARELTNYTGDLQSYNDKMAELDKIQGQIDEVSELASQYGALTSAYNKWQNAMSAENNRDSFEAIGASYEDMKAILDQGWYNDASLNAYLDLMLSASERTGDAITDFNKLTQVIEGTDHSLMDYFTYDEDGNLLSNGLVDFLEDVNKIMGDEYAWLDENGWNFDFSNGKIDEVAEQFGTTTEFLQLAIGAMKDVSDTVQFEEIAALLDLISISAEDAAAALQELGYEVSLDVNTEDLDSLGEQIKTAQQIYDDLLEQSGGVKLDMDLEGAEEAQSLLISLVRNRQELTEPAIMQVDATSLEDATTETVNAIELIQEFVSLSQQLELESVLGIDTSETEAALQRVSGEISDLNTDVLVSAGLDEDSAEALRTQLADIATTDVTISQESVDAALETIRSMAGEINSELDGVNDHELEDKNVTITATDQATPVITGVADELDTLPPTKDILITTYRKTVYSSSGDDGSDAEGTAHSSGTAKVEGDWSVGYEGYSLGAEEGPEIVVRDGKWFTIGEEGAEFFHHEPNDIIFSAEQSRQLLEYGKIRTGDRRGTSYATGSLTSTGGTGGTGSGLTRSQTSTSSTAKSKSSSSSSSSSKSSSSSSSTVDEFLEKFDWVEIAIARIEREIDNLDRKVESVYKTWSSRNSNLTKEISKVNEEIQTQSKAYDRYIKEANSVGLSETYAAKVRNGTIDISTITNEDLYDQIQEYQEWYEKALDCADAIEELHETLASLYEERFNNIVSEYEERIGLLEDSVTTAQNELDLLSEKGYLTGANYYNSMIADEQQTITLLNQELKDLNQAMSDAVSSGEIAKYSEAWYDMQSEINSVSQAIQDATLAITKYQNALDQLNIDRFTTSVEWAEAAISRLDTTASTSYKGLIERLSAMYDEIPLITDELDMQLKQQQEYLARADEVALPDSLKKAVQQGIVDLNDYDDATVELIQEYEKWYGYAMDVSDAIDELNESLSALYESGFNALASDYDNQLSLFEHVMTTYNNAITDVETRGYLVSTQYYEALQKAEEQSIAIMKNQLSDLQTAMSAAVDSGAIEVGSEAWYDMQQEINGVTESLQEATTALVEYNNAIRDLEWSYFDYLEDQIGNVTSETEFLISLLSNSDLYTDNGQLTDAGMSVMGLHAQEYNVYMAQADDYAQELQKINEELAEDPYNTDLVERREELLELQRESILAAEDEKNAIIDMVQEGIDLELSSLKDLIDSYSDALDSAKD